MPKTKSSTKAKTAKPVAKAAAVKPPSAEPISRATTATRSASATRPRSYKDILSRPIRGDITLGALFAELIGTFVLVGLLLSTNGNAIVAGITVLFFTMAFSRLSGGHVNPAVTIALAATRQISVLRAVGYIVAQLLGAMLALVVIGQFVHTSAGVPNPYTGEMTQPQVFKLDVLNGNWRPFFAETLGALVLGIGVAAARFTRREGLEAGYLVGGALILGLLLATQGSAAVLNPAATLGLDGYKWDNAWTFAVYAAGPIIGAVAGAWLFRLLQWDEAVEAKEA